MPPKPTGVVPNPLRPENWPANPTTEAEFERWMTETRNALHAWLDDAKHRLHDDEAAAKAIRESDSSTEALWARYEPSTDLETGTIHNRTDLRAMHAAMKADSVRRKEVHDKYEGWHWHVVRKFATMAWEDFLYYQNVWNRRYFDANARYYETKMERTEAEKQEKKEKAKLKSKHGPVLTQDDFWSLFNAWLANVIELYTRFQLAYRKRMAATIGPAEAHRYSQPSRGTTSEKLPMSQARHEHLEVRFPRQKRKRGKDTAGDNLTPEERYPPRSEIDEDKRREQLGQMEPIAWQLDGEAVQREKTRIESDGKYKKAQNYQATMDLLPAGHVLHHGSLETSFDWPTSFDGEDGGTQIGLTMNKKEYIYEGDEDVEGMDPKDLEKRRDATGKVRKVEPKPRYKKIPVGKPQLVDEFEHDLNDDGTVVGRDRWTGEWPGRTVKKRVQEMDFESIGRNKRTTLPSRFLMRRRFQVRLIELRALEGTRRGIIEEKNKMDEISDDEQDDCTKNNMNYPWSGNANPHQVGDWSDSREDGGAAGTGIPGDDDDEESDDDGDLFKQSYEECSGTTECPKRKRARQIHARMISELGPLPGVTLGSIVEWLDENLGEAEIRAEYRGLLDLYNAEV